MTIDTAKLIHVIRTLDLATQGLSTTARTCVGMIDGKQIILCLEADPHRFVGGVDTCVEVKS